MASVNPRSRQASRTSASTGRSSSTNSCRPARSRSPATSSSARASPSLVHEQVDVDLELARADGRRDAVALAPALLERPRDLGLARAVEAQHAPFGFTRAREHRPHRLRLERPRPEPLQLARRPGQHDDRATLGLEHERRRRAGDPDDERALRQRRLLAHARCEVGVRPSEPLGDRAGDRLDLRLEPLVDDELATRRTRDELDGPVVVGRPEAARDAAEIGLEPLAQRCLELGRVVADDRDPRRLDAEPQQLRGEERPVQVAPVAADELAAGDDDEAARAAQAAREKPCVREEVRAGAGSRGRRGRCRPPPGSPGCRS